jgi:hypothetical protein
MLYGPGNSQPHKTGCGTHQVDVHALKAHGGAGCAVKSSEHGQSQEHGKSNEHGNSSSGASESTEDHVTICHATGSSSHPFVVISPSSSGVFHGHMGHQDVRDVVPTFTYGGQTLSLNWTAQSQSLFGAGCGTESAPTTQVTTSTPTTAVITAQQAQQAAQQTTQQTTTATQTTTAASTPQSSTPQSSTPSQSSTPQSSTSTPQGTPATQNTAGTPSGVNGAQAGNNSTPTTAAGVAGASTSQPASRGTLPFTGLPLWIVLAVGAGLLAAGALARFGASASR